MNEKKQSICDDRFANSVEQTLPVRLAAFTLVELLVVIALIAILAALLLPALAKAKAKGKQVACFNNMRQLALAARLYMDDYNGGLFHHHEGWVLDDGTQVDALPSDLGGVAGGGMGNSQAEKPWVIFFQPYLNSRPVGYCPIPGLEKPPWRSGARASMEIRAGFAMVGTAKAQTTFTWTGMWNGCRGTERGSINFPIIK